MPGKLSECVFLVISSLLIPSLEAISYPVHQTKNDLQMQKPLRPIMGSRKPLKQALAPIKKHDDMLGPDGPFAAGVNQFLTPWPSQFITDTTNPLVIKILLAWIAPILCVVIALQAWVTYYGPSNAYDGSWSVPLRDTGYVAPATYSG